MSNIINTALGVGNTNEKPIFTAANCLNRRQKKFVCTTCHEVCPGQVFSMDPKKELDWKKCKNCGMCVSLCPTRAFAPNGEIQRLYTHDIDLGQAVTFSCYTEKDLADKTVECLAGVPWELFAFLALYTDVVLYTGNCETCDDPKRIEHITENLEKIKTFLGEEKFNERVHLVKTGSYSKPPVPEQEAKEISRREIFSDVKKSITKNIYKTVLKRVPFLDDIQQDGLQYREMLSKAVMRKRENIRKAVLEKYGPEADAERYMPRYGMNLPAYTTACYGCGICEKVCPHQAIEIGPVKDGKRIINITPWKCSECTLCTRVCPYGGFAGMRPVKIPHLEKLALVRVNGEECQKCKRAIKPDSPNGLCPSCAAKATRR